MGELLTTVFFDNKTTNYDNNQMTFNTEKVDNSFEEVFNKSSSRDFDNSDKDVDDNNYNNKPKEENNKNDIPNKDISTNDIKNNDNIKEIVEEENSKTKDEIKEEIASVLATLLNLDISAVIQFLSSNEITLDSLKEFIMTELNIEIPAELLDIENIGQILKELDTLVNEMQDAPETLEEFEELLQKISEEVTEDSLGNAKKSNNTKIEENVIETVSKDNDINSTKVVEELNTTNTNNVEENTEIEGEVEEVKSEESNTTTTLSKDSNNQEASQFSEGQNQSFNFEQNQEEIFFGVNQENIEIKDISKFSRVVNTRMSNFNSQNVLNQIVEKVKFNFNPSYSEIKVQLTPENLGDVTLKVITENGIITAQFIAENEKVKEILESNFTQLEDTLKQKGLDISELSVSIDNGNESNEDKLNHYKREQSKSSKRIAEILNETAEEEVEEHYIDNEGMVKSTISYSV